MPSTPRIATKDGEDVRDPAEEIKESILAGILGEFDPSYEADNIQWAEGFHRAFEEVIGTLDSGSQLETRLHFIQLLKGIT